MSALKMRFIGGPLSGQVVWVEDDCTSLNVQIAAKGETLKRTVEYRRDGQTLLFVEER
jgi:hypothetical protein